ncbi:MAG: CBS domain-containing protein [Nitrospiraceae bacterium]|nr:MAG: CBS domain-containing protein [Nitrospiraceae bacterium]
MITEESINFFKNIPPFQFLDDSDIRRIAGELSLEFTPKNAHILTQDGPPSEALRVIKKGGVKVYLANDDEIVIDYKSEGDSFGYLSLISGDKSRANVIAVEDTLCYLIPKKVILDIINRNPHFGEYFMKSFFKNYLDKTYSEMRNKNLLFKEGEKLLYTTRVRDILCKKPVTIGEDSSISEAAGIMSQQRISSIIVTDGGGRPAGIVTDRDLRDKVVAKGITASRPVKEIMSTGLVSVRGDSTCFDALSTMLQRNIHHLLVMEDNSLTGVVTNHDFMLMQGTSPLSILKNIDRQQNAEELRSVSSRIDQVVAILLKEGIRATSILRIITELHDRLLKKLIDLSISQIGAPHCPFAFFVYGAEGRKEETFKTVFRCALVYETQTTYCEKKEMEEFCDRLLADLQETFGKCGLPLFDIHPLGDGKHIYGDREEWHNNILTALGSGNDSIVSTAKKMLDLRAIYGDESIVVSLKDLLYKKIRENGRYLPALIEKGTQQKSPLGFFRKFVVDEQGEQQEKFDVKEKGASHIIDALRALSISQNIHETSTIERLNLLARKGIVPQDLQNSIYSAFEFLLHLLMQSQLLKKERGLKIDNVLEPEKLSMLERKSLKEVFEIVPVLQETVKRCLHHSEAAAP